MINIISDRFKIENIELVIFDKDGTFIDIHTYWGRVVELRATKIIEYYNLDESFFEPLCAVMGYDIQTKLLPPDSPVGLYSRDRVQEILQFFLIKNDIDASIEDINSIFQEVAQDFISEQEEYTVVIPEAVDLMNDIKNTGAKMVVVTSDSKDNAEHTIKKRGLDKLFDGIYGAEDSKTPKTSGEIVKNILNKMNIKPENTICIGDTYDDYLMAQNSGIKGCINVSTGVVTMSQHKDYNDFCVSSLKELTILQS